MCFTRDKHGEVAVLPVRVVLVMLSRATLTDKYRGEWALVDVNSHGQSKTSID